MTVATTGADGHLDWSTALRLADRSDGRVIAVDDCSRRDRVAEVGSVSATPIADLVIRVDANPSLSFVRADLTDRSVVDRLLSVHDPDTVVHLPPNPAPRTSRPTGTAPAS
jgi:nucleoside-diphosphate-sugar epimerase